ncbi:MAG: alcohol dehydrogenase catalytic domain-containing protein [Acidimicrobiales bacterium]|jgi:L-iditol 2-dehydrogenase
MKVLAYRGPGSLVVEERPQPHPGRGEALLQVDACSICGTDVRIANGSHRAYADALGRVPGHEVVGTVVEVGEGARAGTGERVFVAPNYGCGHCAACRLGQVNMCEEPRAIGITEDGGFAEYLLLPKDLVDQGNLLPFVASAGSGASATGELDVGAVALAEPLACALRGSRACRIGEGDVVLVYGAGPVGLFHLALARLAGAGAVVVCEPNPERRRRALSWGATSAHGADFDELRAALVSAGAPKGANAVIVAAPVPAAQAQALELAGPWGRVNFFAGLARGHSRAELDTNLIHYKELVVTGTTASTNEECRDALNLIVEGRVDAGSLVEARFDLASAAAAFELAASGKAMKVLVAP